MFLNFINEKYATEAAAANQTPFEYTNTTVYAYQKITKTTNLETLTENVVYTNLTQAQYNSLSETTNTYTIPNSPSCKVEITKRILTIFDYEYELNESKRIIKVLNETFVADFERAFEEAMRT